jgi:phosphopantothenoylcysteine decarboxylase / phosphopantothenate---cysteine ligase
MKDMPLQGKKILLGISGGIAAYKAAELVRLLMKAGAHVDVVMTRNATQFITPLTLQTLCGNPVLTDTFDLASGAEIKHITLADEADAIVLAPATANLIGKLANGIADDLLTTLMLVARCPVIVAPAMNVHMWNHPRVAANVATLREMPGYRFVDPVEGLLACGWEGKGKLADVTEIFADVLSTVSAAVAEGAPKQNKAKPDLSGRHVLVTAGPTREYIDPVRFLSNPSTGKMGIAIAQAAAARGARVTLVLGPTAEPVPPGIHIVRVESADEMYAAARDAFGDCDVFVASAAVADYRPLTREVQKVKKSAGGASIELTRTPDILYELSTQKANRVLVGFAAETTDVVWHAREKLIRKSCDFIVANDVTAPGCGFGTETNRAWFVKAAGEVELPLLGKRDLADRILDQVVEIMLQRHRI